MRWALEVAGRFSVDPALNTNTPDPRDGHFPGQPLPPSQIVAIHIHEHSSYY